MTPEAAIAALDRGIEQSGQPIQLLRSVGAAPNAVVVAVDIVAMVRGYSATDLLGDVAQGDRVVTLSPTTLAATQWPGGRAPDYMVEPEVPLRTTDRVTIDGRTFNIQSATPFKIAGVLVKIKLNVRG